jgi:hypothetical protein
MGFVMSGDLILKRGERAVIVGSTGTGKTQMLLRQMMAYPCAPIYVLDTKGDPALNIFLTQERRKDNCEIITKISEIKSFAKNRSGAEYAHILPPPEILADPMLCDEYLSAIYAADRSCLVCIDEAYQVHTSGGRAGPGLLGLLSRGRSKGISVISCTQRPAWTSRFLYSEATCYFVYKLNMRDDYKTLAAMGLPIDAKKLNIDKYQFMYYKNGDDGGTLYAPLDISINPGVTGNDNNLSRWI